MFTTLRNAWKIPELRKKILFTLFVLLIYRLGSCVPVPYVNVAVLNKFEDGAVVDAAALIEKGILHDCKYGLKVLGNCTVSKKDTVKAAAFSESAKEKIEKAGGKAEVV